MSIAYVTGSILLTSTLSFAGMWLFSIRQSFVKRTMLFIISFSTGALLGDVFLHMLPEMAEESALLERSWFMVLGGVLLSFILEKFIHWHHCHVMPSENHYHPVGTMALIGDSIHNLLDGMLIAGAFLVDTTLGIATTIAVILHEVPQEISDYALMVYSGYSRKKALLFNGATTLLSLAGGLLVLGLGSRLPDIGLYLVPLTAGNFLYIAGSDLIPELHKETGARRSTVQLLSMMLGIGFMAALTLFE